MLGGLVVSIASDHPGPRSATTVQSSAPTAATHNGADVTFVQGMIPHTSRLWR